MSGLDVTRKDKGPGNTFKKVHSQVKTLNFLTGDTGNDAETREEEVHLLCSLYCSSSGEKVGEGAWGTGCGWARGLPGPLLSLEPGAGTLSAPCLGVSHIPHPLEPGNLAIDCPCLTPQEDSRTLAGGREPSLCGH